MKVGFSKTFPVYGKEEWEKNWLEDDIPMPENLIDLSDEEIEKYMLKIRRIQYALKKQVESFFYESTKADQKREEELKTKNIEPIIGVTPEEIYSCKEIEGEDGLKSYKAIAKTNQELQKAYDEQFKKLCK